MATQPLNINSTLEKLSLIGNIPIEFSINDRRPITVILPTIRDSISELDFKLFLSLISLSEESIKKTGLKLPFNFKDSGEIIQGFIAFTEYRKILSKYFLKYLKNSTFNAAEILIDGEKVLSYELEYIANILLIASGARELKESDIKKDEKQKEEIDPATAKILQKQKEAEEKLRKAKAKKADKTTNSLSIEEIMLAISYEFGFSFDSLLDKNYYAIIWYFSFVGKVDAHKLNQLILSSGFAKKQTYNYWLNGK